MLYILIIIDAQSMTMYYRTKGGSNFVIQNLFNLKAKQNAQKRLQKQLGQ